MLKCPAVTLFYLLLQGFKLTHVPVVSPVQLLIARQGMVFAQQLTQSFQSIGNVIVDGLVILLGQILIQIGHLDIVCAPQFTAVRQDLTQQYLHERGLAGTVLTQNTDAFALVNGQRDLVEQGVVAKGERQVVESEQQHMRVFPDVFRAGLRAGSGTVAPEPELACI